MALLALAAFAAARWEVGGALVLSTRRGARPAALAAAWRAPRGGVRGRRPGASVRHAAGPDGAELAAPLADGSPLAGVGAALLLAPTGNGPDDELTSTLAGVFIALAVVAILFAIWLSRSDGNNPFTEGPKARATRQRNEARETGKRILDRLSSFGTGDF